MRFSDHRPVYAMFQCAVSIVDEPVREALSRKLYEKRKAEVGGTIANTRADDTDDEDLIGYDAIEPGLPPASSDRKKWWLDNGQPARSTIQPPGPNMIPNPRHPSNPWTTTDEPDWITVHSQSTRNGSVASLASTSTAATIRGNTTTNYPISVTRKLPPPFDGRAGTPVQETQRRSSVASVASQSSSSKKGPPPIARKPLHLSSSSSTSSPSSLKSSTTFSGSYGTGPGSASIPIRSMEGVQTEFPPPPKRASTGFGTGDGGMSKDIVNSGGNGSNRDSDYDYEGQGRINGGNIGVGGNERPPPPQPRRSGTGNTLRKAMPIPSSNMPAFSAMGRGDGGPRLPPRPVEAVDLLSGDDDLKGWEALKPMS